MEMEITITITIIIILITAIIKQAYKVSYKVKIS